MTAAGEFTKRVVVERDEGAEQAASGAVAESWTFVAEFWAKLETLSARELIAAQQVQSNLSHKITLRSSAATRSIRASDRLCHGLRIFQISGPPMTNERDATVTLLCTERLPS